MAYDLQATVMRSRSWAQNGLQTKHRHKFQLLPATGAAEYGAIDILGPLQKTLSGNEHILKMTD